MHKMVVEAIAVIRQYDYENGYPSFDRGYTRKNVIFQIASGPILSIPFHFKTCQYDLCKVSLKKRPLPYL
jgi:hypothetical protein